MLVGLDKEISEILEMTNHELKLFQKKIDTPDEKITEQFVGDIISNLQRREHALKHRLYQALTQNKEYHIPEDWTARILKQIEVMLADTTTKAKVEMLASHQAAFWGVLQDIKEVLIKPTEVALRVLKVDAMDDRDDRGAGG
ncbi:MAG: hypothetical protein Q8K75_10140 [Chlamydiales bacterium]|nr:hypothetical protein [Chlamydiales bacterium]